MAALALASASGCGGDAGTSAAVGAAASWTAIGPDGGRIRTLAVEPGPRAGLYAGVGGGGLFRSRDRGETWTSLGLTDLDVFAIAVDPGDPGTIYAAGAQGFPAPSLRGVFKSADAGRTWVRSDTGMLAGEPTPGPVDVFALAIDPRTPTTLYAGASFGGVFTSVDAGATWTPSGLRHVQAVVALAIDPATPSTVYAATRFEGVFKSVDAGATWEAASRGLASPEFPGLAVLPLNTLVVDPRSPTTLYVGPPLPASTAAPTAPPRGKRAPARGSRTSPRSPSIAGRARCSPPPARSSVTAARATAGFSRVPTPGSRGPPRRPGSATSA